MGIVAAGVTTRYLGVDDYGALTAAIGFTSIANLVTDLGITTVGSREIAKHPERTQRLVSAIVTAGLGLSMLGMVVGVGLTLTLYGGSDDHLIRTAALLLLSTLPLTAFYGAAGAYFVSRQQPYMGMIGSVVSSVITLGVLVASTVFDWGFTGVVLAYVVAYLAQWAIMVTLASGKIRLRPSRDFRLARQLLGWALPLGVSFLIGVIYWRIDIVMLSKLSSEAEVGLYGLAYKMVDALAVIAQFVLITLTPEFARLAANPRRFDQIVEKAFSAMQLGSLGVCVPFALFAPEITDLVGGDAFDKAGTLLRIRLIGVALSFLSAAIGQAIVAKNRQRSLMSLSALVLVANVLVNLALIPLWGATGAATAFAVSEIAHLAAILYIYRRFAPVPHLQQGGRVFLAAAVMCVAAAVKLLPVGGSTGSILDVALGIPLSLVLYIVALYALKAMPPELQTNLLVPAWSRVKALVPGASAGVS